MTVLVIAEMARAIMVKIITVVQVIVLIILVQEIIITTLDVQVMIRVLDFLGLI